MSDQTVQTESVNLAIAEENALSSKRMPTVGWWNLQPNSYGTFGPSYKKDPRDPISKNAQLRKGMLTDLDSGLAGEFDITKFHVDRFAPGILRCAPKHPGNTGNSDFSVSAVTSTGYTVSALGAIAQHFLTYGRGFEEDANNGLKELGAGSTNTEIKTAGLVANASVPANAEVAIAGYRGATGDIRFDASGNLTSQGAVDFTTWGLNRFQYVSIGDPNNPTNSFANLDFVGPARIRKVEALKITFDKRSWLVQQKAYLDLGDLAANLDTVVQAVTAGGAGDSITVAAIDDGDAAVKAHLDVSTKAAHINTVVRARVAGADGNAVTLEVTTGAPTAAGVRTEVGTNVKIQIKITATASTVADFEALIAASTLLEVQTAGTGATSLDGTDAFASTALAGGTEADPVTVTEVSSAVTIHFTGSSSTVADVEAAIVSDATLIEVKTAGTPGAVLVHTNDEFAATALDHGNSGADAGTGKRIDVYFGPWYRNVATDHDDYRTPDYALEVTYQTLDEGAPKYEYLRHNMIDECTWNFDTASKSTMSLKFVGLTAQNPTATRTAGASDAKDANANEGVSTSVDLQRLRLMGVDEVGISVDFVSSKVTSSNGVTPQKQLAQLGGKYMNIGHHKTMLDTSLIFVTDEAIRAVKDNRTCSMDTMLRNSDFGVVHEILSLTLDSNDRKLERDKIVTLDTKGSGFQDAIAGSTESLSTFPYLPPLLAEDPE